MLDVEVNGMILGIFTSATMKAAVHLGPDFDENLRTTKKTVFEQVKNIVRNLAEFDPESQK